MKRREFLIAAAIATKLPEPLRAQRLGDANLDRIAIMTLCFSSVLKSPAHTDDPRRTLDILELPGMIASRYGVHNVEYQHSHFASTETPYLKTVHESLRKANSRMNQINVEFGALNISSPDPVLRVETIDLTKQWIDHAVILGCPRVMLNQGTLAPEVRNTAIETLKTIVAYGKSKKIFVTLENRGAGGGLGRAGAPAPVPWEVLVEVIKASGARANPDIGNFPNDEARRAGLRALYPLSSGSSHCHYDPSRYSEADALAISKEVGYKGLYSIEAVAGNGPDPYTAVQTILEEVLKDI